MVNKKHPGCENNRYEKHKQKPLKGNDIK